jgi:hypothetical protein
LDVDVAEESISVLPMDGVIKAEKLDLADNVRRRELFAAKEDEEVHTNTCYYCYWCGSTLIVVVDVIVLS